MKKQLLFGALLGVMLLYAITPAQAAWEKIKEEAEGTYYIDTSAYRCTCTGADTMYFKVKQVPTHSNAKYIINNMKVSLNGPNKAWVYNHATRYYNSGFVEDVELPPALPNPASNSALSIALQKTCKYCDVYCKGR